MQQQKIKTWIVNSFVLIVLLLSTMSISHSDENDYAPLAPIEFILDQYQENDTYETNLHGRVSLAQEFIPTMSPLTKVEVKINKPRRATRPLVLSIRSSLDGSDLATGAIQGDNVPFFTNWLEFDINDLDVDIGEKYYIVLSSSTQSEYPFRWKNEYSDMEDIYENGTMYRYFHSSDIWEPVETSSDYVDACFRTYSYISHTDLVCAGFLNWTDVQPGQDNLTGFFTVRNDGTPYSNLDWKILTWPSWGTWEFSYMNGTGLQPEDGTLTVNIHVVAPNFNVPDEYLGRIIIKNINEVNDTEVIDARLVTPKGKSVDDFIFNGPFLSFLRQSRLFHIIKDFDFIQRIQGF